MVKFPLGTPFAKRLRTVFFGLVSFQLAFMGLFSSIQPAAAAGSSIVPIAECVAVNPDGTYTGYFGFRNTNPTDYTIAHGLDNRLLGGTIQSGNSVTYFPANSEVRYPTPAFSVKFTGGAVTWFLRTPGHVLPDLALVSANSHITDRCALAGDVTPPTLNNVQLVNPSLWGMGYNILNQPNHNSTATGRPTIGGTVMVGADFNDNSILTNVLGGVSSKGFFSDSDWTPFPTNNNTWNPVPQGQYLATWNTKTGPNWMTQPDGNYTIFLDARDKGTQSGDFFFQHDTYKYIDVTLDNTPPTIGFLTASNPPAGVVHGVITVIVGANDANGLMNTDIGVHGISWVCHTDWPAVGVQTCSIDTRLFPNGPQKITAQARDKAGNTTQIFRDVIFDNEGPSIPVLLSPANGAVLHSTGAQFMDWTDSTDPYSPPVTYEYQVATNPAVDGDGSFVTNIYHTTTTDSNLTGSTAPGVYYWQVRSVDNSGNHSAWTTPWKVTIDDTAPSLPVHLSPADGAYRTTAALDKIDWTDSTDDLSNVHYFYEASNSSAVNPDGTFVSPIYQSGALTSSEIPTAGTPEGVYYWHVRAVDEANNSSAWTTPWKVTVDNTAPTTPIHLSPANGSYTTTADQNLIDWTDSTDSSPLHYLYEASNTNDLNGDGSFTSPVYQSGPLTLSEIPTSGTPEGVYYWHVRAVDEAGNMSPWTDAWKLTVDNTAPSLPVHLTPADGTYTTTANQTSIDWTDSSDTNPVHYLYESSNTNDLNPDGSFVSPVYGPASVTDSTIPTPGTPEGTYYWHVMAVDASGNHSAWTSAWKVIVDNTAPATVTHVSPANGSFLTTAAWVKADWTDSSDANPFSYYYEASNTNTVNEDGSFTSPVYVSSALGTSEIPTPGTPEGVYYWHVQVRDAAGNKTAWTSPWKVTVDNTAPLAPTPLSPADGTKIRGIAFTQTWTTVADAVSYTYESCNVNPGNAGAPCSSVRFTGDFATAVKNVAAGQPDSHFWWRVKAIDAASNTSAFGPAFEMTIDNDAPVVTLVSVNGSSTTNTQPSFTGTSADVYLAGLDTTQYRIMKVGTPDTVVTDWQNLTLTGNAFSFAPASALAIGTYRMEVRATDLAGNTSATVSQQITITAPGGVGGDNLPLPNTNNTGGSNGSGSGTAKTEAVATQATPAPTATVAPTATPSASPSPTEKGSVKGAETTAGSHNYLWWLLLIPAVAIIYWFLIGRKRDDEENI